MLPISYGLFWVFANEIFDSHSELILIMLFGLAVISLFITTIYTWSEILKAEVQHHNDKIKKNLRESPNNGKKEISFGVLPKQLFNTYNEITSSDFRLSFNTPIGKARSRYIETDKSNNSKKSERANSTLYIEHQFKYKFIHNNAYVHIKWNEKEGDRNTLWYLLIWPFLLRIVLLVVKANDKMLFYELGNFIETFGIHKNIAYISLTLLSWIIPYILISKIVNYDSITLENHEFERMFDVDTNDPIAARQLCNPYHMLKIQEWYKKHNLNNYVELYFDIGNERMIFKFDFLRRDQNINIECIENYISLSSELIQNISNTRNCT